ncbi:MAG: DNA cytosine methyltransferase [Oscillospiraceae bacterium]
MTALRLGSLFDGIGVFPLAAVRCGIEPIWASEIEKAPISITKRHFPEWFTRGDGGKLDGRDLPPVDIIAFGSPCQNLSPIGNRKGLAGEKPSLFLQATRIIREMREATNGLFPAIAVWENVMGAFRSNDRMDFRAVLSTSQTPMFQCLLLEDGQEPEWCEGERLTSAGGSWTPSIGQAPDWHDGSASFLWQTLENGVPTKCFFKPRTMQSLPAFGGDRGLPAACGDGGSFIEAGRRVPVTRPFQCFRMRASAKERTETAFRNSFGLPTDPFSTLLAGGISPFAFWYGRSAGGCVRFPPEAECERLMGLPEGWTRYGADGKEILSSHRYRALGNAIALPCAEYVMAVIAEALTKGGANDDI